MKIVILLFLLAYSQAVPAEVKKKDEGKTEKRALVEGNAGIEKRAPSIDTVSPSPVPGIVYADSKDLPSDKSPTQDALVTSQPQVAKISDVLSGQGHSFPTAIENHLYSPVQVYQPRLGSPTTYEVSAPIPAQLAYTETKTYQQPQQNSIFFDPQKQQKQFARVTVNFGPQPFQQHFLQQQHQFLQQSPQQFLQQPPQQIIQQQPPQRLIYQQPPQQIIQQQSPQHFVQQQPPSHFQQQPPQQFQQQPPQQLIQQQPQQNYYQQHQAPQSYPAPQFLHFPQHPFNQVPVPYNQFPVPFNHQGFIQQPFAFNQQSPLALIHPVQHGVTYTNQGQKFAFQQPAQREVKTAQPAVKVNEKVTIAQTQFNDKSQGAVSYASFSQSQPSPNFIQAPNTYSAPASNNLPPPSPTPNNYISSSDKLEAPVQNNIPSPKPVLNQSPPNKPNVLTYYRPQVFQALPQYYSQPQVYPQQQEVVVQNAGFGHAPVAAAPTFPPVQYFGKFASQIFGGYTQ